ncbi:MAG: hypothetical protein ACP5VQ_10630, partial [Phycisphaerae bacterium]
YAVPMQFGKDVHQHLLGSLIRLIVGHLGFVAIWGAVIFFSLRSAWRAIRGLSPSHPLWMMRRNGDAV